MNLLSMLGAWGSGRQTSDAPVEEYQDDTSASEYVDWFLKHMLQTSRMEMALDTAKSLPDGEGTSKDPWMRTLPDAQAVVNRLKVVSGLNPIHFQKPTIGRFERVRGTLVFTYETRFEDGPDSSRCRILARVGVGVSR